MKEMEKNIILKCSICGNDQFSTIDENIEDIQNAPEYTEVMCSDCKRIITKAQLLEENAYIINANIEDFKKDILKEVQKDIEKLFK